jgi:hypothetical protein
MGIEEGEEVQNNRTGNIFNEILTKKYLID